MWIQTTEEVKLPEEILINLVYMLKTEAQTTALSLPSNSQVQKQESQFGVLSLQGLPVLRSHVWVYLC